MQAAGLSTMQGIDRWGSSIPHSDIVIKGLIFCYSVYSYVVKSF